MQIEQFKKHAHELVEWMSDYLGNIEKYPVKSQMLPGELLKKLPARAPIESESFQKIFSDFNELIIPGMTHWQHPSFFAYFPANSSPPSVLAEMLMATMGAQCMSWQTSPAATELEEKVISWLLQMLGIPPDFDGCIQDTASTATLCALLAAREKASDYQTNVKGLSNESKFIVYASAEAHSSVERAVKIAGIGTDNLRKISVTNKNAIDVKQLSQQIALDIKNGSVPLCVIASLGTTGTTAVDSLDSIGDLCNKYKIWLHVDAAYAGSALILPEMRWMIKGVEKISSFVFNPHKWLLTNFDCSVLFVRHKQDLVRTFEILPEYLKTAEGDKVNNYRDWGIQLGRRFRALKLWFVIRSYGVSGLQNIIKEHLRLAQLFSNWIKESENFELTSDPLLATVCFRYVAKDACEIKEQNKLNKELLEKLNQTGKMYLSSTVLNNVFVLRLSIGQTYTQEIHVRKAWDLIKEKASLL